MTPASQPSVSVLGAVLVLCLVGLALAAAVMVNGPVVPGAVAFLGFAGGAVFAALAIARRLEP